MYCSKFNSTLLAVFLLLPCELLALENAEQSIGQLETPAPDELALTLQEREYIKQAPELIICDVLTGSMEPFAEMIRWLSADTDLRFTFSKPLSWSEGLGALQNGTCDLLPGATETQERQALMNFTPPYAKRQQFVFAPIEQAFVPDINAHLDKVFVLNQGNILIDKLTQAFPSIKINQVNHSYDAIQLVENGAAFAYVAGEDANQVIDTYSLKKIKIAGKLPSQFDDLQSIATRKDKLLLSQILSKMIRAKGEGAVNAFLAQFHTARAETLQLNDEEKTFIASAPSTTLCRVPMSEGIDRTVQLIDLLTRDTGLHIQVSEPLAWGEALVALANKQCDILPSTSPSEEREKYLVFTEPYARIARVLVTKKGHAAIAELSNHLDEVFAINKGDLLIDTLRQYYPLIKIKEVAFPIDGARLVQQGKAFAYIGALSNVKNMLELYVTDDLSINGRLRAQFDDVQAIATRKEDLILQQILAKAVRSADKREVNALLNQSSSVASRQIHFSEDEKAFLVWDIVQCNVNSDAPLIEMMAFMVRDTKVRLVNSQPYAWHEALEALKNGDCDFLPGATETEERRKTMLFTPPFHQAEQVIATSMTQGFISSLDDYLDQEFVLPKGYLTISQLKAEYPGLKMTFVDSPIEGLNLVQEKQAFAYVDSIINTGNVIRKYVSQDIKIAGTLPDRFNDVWAIATRKEDIVLHGILSKLVENVDRIKIRQILFGDLTVKYEQGFDYTRVWQILLAATVLLVSVTIWNRRLAELRLKVKGLLDSSGEGFLSFGQDLKIEKEYSRQCLQIFECENLSGNNIEELLYPSSCRDKNTLIKGLKMLFNSDDFNKKHLLKNLLPNRVSLLGKILELNYKLTKDMVVLIVNDVTEQEALKKQLSEEQNTQKKILHALNHKNEVNQILHEFSDFWQGVKSGFNDKERLNTLYRRVHTYKSLFLQMHFMQSAEQLHILEEILGAQLNADGEVPQQKLIDQLEQCAIETVLKKEIDVLRDKLGAHFFVQQREFLLDEQQLDLLVHFGGDKSAVSALIEDIKKVDINDWLEHHGESAREQAWREGKDLAPLLISGDGLRLNEAYFRAFFHSLIHVFRNAVAHGIGSREMRMAAGKSAQGQISCHVVADSDHFELRISDDGCGIDMENLRSKMPRPSKTEDSIHDELKDEEILMYLFEVGYSNAEAVTLDAGRGLGLQEVYKQTQKLNGRVRIESQLGVGTSFIFIIPMLSKQH